MKHQHLLRGVFFLYAFFGSLAVADDAREDAPVADAVNSAAFEELVHTAEQGDGDAQADLADMYAAGRTVPQDFERAAYWRKRAAEQGIARAENALGKQYAAGLGVPQDHEKALSWLQRAAENEDPDFWFDLAVYYEQVGGTEALEAAIDWHSRAVDAGHVGAHAHLGLLYYNGSGAAQDLSRAADLLAYAAERGHARAQNNLGLMLSQGNGVAQDYEKAVALFQSAADQRLKEAYTNLGVMYENGFGVEFDEARAVDLYRQARLQGSLEGLLQQIGFLADPRIDIVVATPDYLQRLLRQAELGDVISQFQCGYHLLGSGGAGGVPADYAAAADLFGKAAANGINTAMTNLGLLYFRGLGVPQDYVLGFMWVSLGARSGRDLLVETRDNLMSFLTASQINEAQRMAREFSAGRRAGIQ